MTNTQHESLGTALQHITREAEQYLEGWKRARADYENLHKRSVDEKQEARQQGTEDALAAFITVLDHFDAAFASIPQDIAHHPWVEGVRHIQKAFHQAMDAQGISVIHATDIPLNPVQHEAVSAEASTKPEGTVLQVVSNGYMLGTRVLRPAKVIVSKGEREKST